MSRGFTAFPCKAAFGFARGVSTTHALRTAGVGSTAR